MGLRFAGVEIVNDDGDRFGSVAGRFQRFQADASEFEDVAIVERSERVRRFRGGAEIDGRADAIAQFEMPGDEIGVEMGEEDVLDGEGVFGGEGEVLIDVALRIDNGGGAGCLVANEVGSVRQARQIELLEDHFAPTGSGFFSRLTSRR